MLLTVYNPCQYPKCKTGIMQEVEILSRIRSPDNVLSPRTTKLNLKFMPFKPCIAGTAIVLPELNKNRAKYPIK